MKMTLKQQLRSIHDWNTQHPVGTKVSVTLDDGKVIATTTTEVAWLLGGHSAVIKTAAISGAYSLARVKAV